MNFRNVFALLVPGAILALSSRANAALLSTLIGGGPIVEGNAIYSNFALLGGSTPAASAINVTTNTTAQGASVITFSVVNGTWTLPADSSRITFDVAFAAPVNAIGLDFVAAGSAGGVASVGETATYPFNGNPVDVPLQVVTDGAGPLTDGFSAVVPLAQNVSTLSIVKSIDIASSGGVASITSVSNTYYAVPEPASLAALALAMPLLLKRRRLS